MVVLKGHFVVSLLRGRTSISRISTTRWVPARHLDAEVSKPREK